MAKKSKRPAPNLTDLRPVPSPPPPLEFYVAAYLGLLEWIKRRHPGAFLALSQHLTTIGRDWEHLRTKYGLGPEALAVWVVGLIPRLPSRLPKPGDTCNPFVLLWHYQIACDELRAFPKRAKRETRDPARGIWKRRDQELIPPHQLLWLREHATDLLLRMQKPPMACWCRQRRTTVPPDEMLARWIRDRLTPAKMATRLVAHHHHKSSTMHRLLSKASTLLRQIRQERSPTSQAPSSPF